jgi:hypothetical protein
MKAGRSFPDFAPLNPGYLLTPRPIMMRPAFSTPEASDEGRNRGVVRDSAVLIARVRTKTRRGNDRTRHCERSEAIQVACVDWEVGWIASSLLLLAMTNI